MIRRALLTLAHDLAMLAAVTPREWLDAFMAAIAVLSILGAVAFLVVVTAPVPMPV